MTTPDRSEMALGATGRTPDAGDAGSTPANGPSGLDIIVESFLGDEVIDGPIAVGSSVTCNPPPNGSDIDVLVLVKNQDKLHELLDGWDYDGGIYASENTERRPEFVSFRYVFGGEILNIIATDDKDFFAGFLRASFLAKRFNLLKKDDRVALFQLVLYGNGDFLT